MIQKVIPLNFGNIPNRWGEDSITIDYSTSSFNLDFDIYLSLQDIGNPSSYLTWYKYDYVTVDSEITLSGLKDDTRYYFYAVSRDLAGNIENPLNTTEFYSSDGLYDQIFDLKYIPLLEWNYDIVIEIDDDLDGSYETIFKEDLIAVGSNQMNISSIRIITELYSVVFLTEDLFLVKIYLLLTM